jgi:hypothetical protein
MTTVEMLFQIAGAHASSWRSGIALILISEF